MSKDTTNKSATPVGAIAIVAAVLFLLLVFMFNLSDGERFDWSNQYNLEGKQPLDITIFYDLFTDGYDVRPIKNRVTDELPDDESAMGAIYCFIGFEPRYSEAEAEHLMRFAERGGTVFISSDELPDSLMQFLMFRSDCGFSDIDQNRRWMTHAARASAQFTHPKLTAAEPYVFDVPQDVSTWSASSWSYFPLSAICGEGNSVPIALLGTIDFFEANNGATDLFRNRTEANFVRFDTKRGHIYIHTTPKFFGNYFMQTEEGLEYANKLLAHFNAKTIYWDRISTQYPKQLRRQAAPNPVPRNPMEYVYGQRNLRAGWYVLLGTTLLFMVFRAKRRQRVIPILPPNNNTSLEFVKTIGRLYFQQQNHRNIFQKLMQHFLAHLRQRYHIVANNFDDAFVERVAFRTDIPLSVVKPIFDRYNDINSKFTNKYTELNVSALNNFYILIQNFHRAEAKNVFNDDKRTTINQKYNSSTKA